MPKSATVAAGRIALLVLLSAAPAVILVALMAAAARAFFDLEMVLASDLPCLSGSESESESEEEESEVSASTSEGIRLGRPGVASEVVVVPVECFLSEARCFLYASREAARRGVRDVSCGIEGYFG